ncbi:hypothetical protein EV127DRAFT_207417 [Xylaria flabelliformis]|nr:hypothetical protein EV127DRAFT_207417 [Xylaria flabelliformis]
MSHGITYPAHRIAPVASQLSCQPVETLLSRGPQPRISSRYYTISAGGFPPSTSASQSQVSLVLRTSYYNKRRISWHPPPRTLTKTSSAWHATPKSCQKTVHYLLLLALYTLATAPDRTAGTTGALGFCLDTICHQVPDNPDRRRRRRRRRRAGWPVALVPRLSHEPTHRRPIAVPVAAHARFPLARSTSSSSAIRAARAMRGTHMLTPTRLWC